MSCRENKATAAAVALVNAEQRKDEMDLRLPDATVISHVHRIKRRIRQTDNERIREATGRGSSANADNAAVDRMRHQINDATRRQVLSQARAVKMLDNIDKTQAANGIGHAEATVLRDLPNEVRKSREETTLALLYGDVDSYRGEPEEADLMDMASGPEGFPSREDLEREAERFHTYDYIMDERTNEPDYDPERDHATIQAFRARVKEETKKPRSARADWDQAALREYLVDQVPRLGHATYDPATSIALYRQLVADGKIEPNPDFPE